jgi:hypothetical protein
LRNATYRRLLKKNRCGTAALGRVENHSAYRTPEGGCATCSVAKSPFSTGW